MVTAMDDRWVEKIPWIAFQNTSGQKIAPFSCITGVWQIPSINDSSVDVAEPFLLGTQPQDPINPCLLYITNDIEVAAGDYGECARPDVYPQQASIGTFSANGIQAGNTCGPTTNNFNMTLHAPGFFVVSNRAQSGYAFVRTFTGLYRGNLPMNTATTSGLQPFKITTFIEPNGVPSSVTYPVNNPYANIDTTQQGAVLRCTYGWVGGAWELVAADPCPPDSD